MSSSGGEYGDSTDGGSAGEGEAEEAEEPWKVHLSAEAPRPASATITLAPSTPNLRRLATPALPVKDTAEPVSLPKLVETLNRAATSGLNFFFFWERARSPLQAPPIFKFCT